MRITMNTRSINFLLLYTKSQLKLKYRHTYLGFLWNFLEPALYLIVLSVIFSVVNRMNVSNYAVYLFGALVPWRYFERTVNMIMDSIAQGDWLLKKIAVSPFVFPLSRWLTASVEFLFSFLVVLLIFSIIKTTWTIHLVVLPLAMIPWAAFGLGMGMVCSAAFVFFRDIRQIVQMFLLFTFFTSPILFKADLFAEHSLQAMLLRLHPFTYFAALFQKPLYYGAWPSLADWGVSSMVGCISLFIGWYLINRLKGRFYFYL
jgi:ABC-type polysaccharide/polyol phosphate export permease